MWDTVIVAAVAAIPPTVAALSLWRGHNEVRQQFHANGGDSLRDRVNELLINQAHLEGALAVHMDADARVQTELSNNTRMLTEYSHDRWHGQQGANQMLGALIEKLLKQDRPPAD